MLSSVVAKIRDTKDRETTMHVHRHTYTYIHTQVAEKKLTNVGLRGVVEKNYSKLRRKNNISWGNKKRYE